jgi:eukaryotic-like serine/threonine-protein kinase
MASREHFLARLLELPRVQDKDVRRGIFRQTIAQLGMGDQGGGPLALAGVDPNALARSVQIALGDALLDDIDFIGPSAAAVALYQIAGALPLGTERREIGRKVLNYLYKGNAETFSALASRMALGSIRPLRGAGIRARVALAVALPPQADSGVDRLALAIVMRRELAREWINATAVGSLPERRLAARLCERAAREAAKRADAGDAFPLRVFQAIVNPARYQSPPRPDGIDPVGPAWRSLLADRETLVWRHVAVARGLLCAAVPEFVDQIKGLLQPHLTPTEWRRGATSLVARVAVDRERGLSDVMGVLDGPLLKRDPGIAMAMCWGLTPVAEVEPEAAEEMAEAIATVAPITIADSLVELRQQVRGFAAQAAEICASALRNSLSRPEIDDGLAALARCILDDLETDGERRELLQAMSRSLGAFAETGTVEAYKLAKEGLGVAQQRVGQLEGLEVGYHGGVGAAGPRKQAMELLRDLDATLLESRTLTNLLLLDRAPGSEATGVEAVDDLDARMARWLLDRRRRDVTPEEIKQQLTLQQRQLRALLHLIDGGSTDFGDDHERRLRVRARWTLGVRAYVNQITKQPQTRLTRAIIATVARAFDALVRDGAAEPIDAFLFAATHFNDADHLNIVGEASMQPDVVQLIAHYQGFMRHEHRGDAAERPRARVEAFKRFLHAFPSQATLRSEAFRTTAWTLVHALESVMEARSLRALVPTESAAAGAGPLALVEDAISQLQQLVLGAERRCSEQVSQQRLVLPRRHALAHAVENAVNTENDSEMVESLMATMRAAEATLPAAIASLVTEVLPRLQTLQIERAELAPIPLVHNKRVNLPDWIPARRIIGGFYVLKPLGGGNVGSVFVVKRAEERHKPDAERFALKVPEYNATAARTIAETEFLQLFREEAGALLSIPEHSNIARFVTFDAGAKPKPLLVMELIEGVSCERIVSSQSLHTRMALDVLDGVMAGLEAMHSTGIAHLDVKPSNVILRERGGQPVLVDFGLSGRRIRPGCATLCYGAPEVWETAPGGHAPGSATAADVYALGCFAYELLTSQTLFDGTSDMAIIAAHVAHDGLPPPIERMAQSASLQPLAMFLYQCLRYDPDARPAVAHLRLEFKDVRHALDGKGWPLRP